MPHILQMNGALLFALGKLAGDDAPAFFGGADYEKLKLVSK
jgi:hypothetical protein